MLTPVGWGFFALSGAAVLAGGSGVVVSEMSRRTHSALEEIGKKVEGVMTQISGLMTKHMNQLNQIDIKMKEVVTTSKTITASCEKAKVKFTATQKNRVKRSLGNLDKHLEELVELCEEYVQTEVRGQQAVAKKLGLQSSQ